MAEIERELLNHYNLTTLYPSEWPAEKDREDESDEELRTSTAKPVRRSKSRYSALERAATTRASVLGAERTRDGVENLVQKDEPDPLGSTGSVVQVLRQRGLPVEDDMKLRNRFLLSSTTFSPALFLSQVHSNASTESLLHGLEFLSRSIEKKSASLKVLVESNFERFVRAKATIDNVYTEMRDQGKVQETQKRPHSRHASKSGGFSPSLGSGKPPSSDKKKNALTKESEYGVLGIKAPLLELAVKAEEVWGPALGGREREEMLKAILASVEKNRGIFELGTSVHDCIKRRDNDQLVEEYAKARRFASEARSIVEGCAQNRTAMTDPEVHQVVITARMWSDVEDQIASFKRDVWRRLAGTHLTKQPAAEDDKPEEHMELITILMELGVQDNPIWIWLLSRYDYLKNKITNTIERAKVEIEILRRRLAQGEQPPLKVLATHLCSVVNQGRLGNASKVDIIKVLEFWEHVYSCMNALLSIHGGVLGEIIEYWETAESFIDGRAQKKLPAGVDGQSRQHHRLSTDGVRDLQTGALELVGLIRDSVLAFFVEPPIEDISMLFSPIPPTPETPRTPRSAALSPSDSRFRFDVNNIPPSPRTGETWEKYAFWPPYANSLGGVQYLSKILMLVGTAASEMAILSIVSKEGSRTTDLLKSLVGGVRERCVQAVCAAWERDAENFKILEDWTRSADRHDLTNMPSRFLALESALLSGMQKMLYVSEAATRSGTAEVIIPPSSKLLQRVREQFISSLYKTLSGMVENANKPRGVDEDRLDDDDADGLTVPARDVLSADTSISTVDAESTNVRILLTLSNLQALRNEIVPQLIAQFETHFSVQLTEETKRIRDALGQIDNLLFQSYASPIASSLSSSIHEGIADPSWAPEGRPTDARPYVYDVLLALVLVHTEVSTTAAPLTSQILKYLLEKSSEALIDAIKARKRYSLSALMQATLDVEFMAQTLNNYTTDRASEIQGAIYGALDERTDNDARVKLQIELSELRAILKKLREGTRGEFACFKRQRAHRERPTSRG